MIYDRRLGAAYNQDRGEISLNYLLLSFSAYLENPPPFSFGNILSVENRFQNNVKNYLIKQDIQQANEFIYKD